LIDAAVYCTGRITGYGYHLARLDLFIRLIFNYSSWT
jgi:hypothetical protein